MSARRLFRLLERLLNCSLCTSYSGLLRRSSARYEAGPAGAIPVMSRKRFMRCASQSDLRAGLFKGGDNRLRSEREDSFKCF